jgi:hypothetical protein
VPILSSLSYRQPGAFSIAIPPCKAVHKVAQASPPAGLPGVPPGAFDRPCTAINQPDTPRKAQATVTNRLKCGTKRGPGGVAHRRLSFLAKDTSGMNKAEAAGSNLRCRSESDPAQPKWSRGRCRQQILPDSLRSPFETPSKHLRASFETSRQQLASITRGVPRHHACRRPNSAVGQALLPGACAPSSRHTSSRTLAGRQPLTLSKLTGAVHVVSLLARDPDPQLYPDRGRPARPRRGMRNRVTEENQQLILCCRIQGFTLGNSALRFDHAVPKVT